MKLRFWLLLIVASSTVYYFVFVPHLKAHSIRSESTHQTVQSIPAATFMTMGRQIDAAIATDPTVDVSVSCIDLGTGKAYDYGVSDVFEAASVGKLVTAVDFMQQVQSGSASLNDNLNGSTAGYELQQLLVDSDNDAWLAFNDQLGNASLLQTAQRAGINDYDPNANTLTAADVSNLLSRLFKRELLNDRNTDVLLGYMKEANEADYIPAAVPKGVIVYHKAGLLDDRIHDAAIIDDSKRPYVLVIFTNGHGTYEDDQRTQLMHEITKDTVEAFISN